MKYYTIQIDVIGEKENRIYPCFKKKSLKNMKLDGHNIISELRNSGLKINPCFIIFESDKYGNKIQPH